MANLTDPNTGILLNAEYQSNQYIPIKRDRRWMSFFSSRVVADAACQNLPPYPAEGYAVIVSGGINNGCIGRYSSELMSWEYMQPWAGLQVQDASGAAWVYSGGVWVKQAAITAGIPAWVLSHPDTPPSVPGVYDDEFNSDTGNWSWVNQGTATVEIASGCMHLAGTASAKDDMNIRVRNVSGNFDIRAKINIQPKALSTFAQGGIVVRNGSSGRMISLTLVYESNGWSLCLYRWTNPTTYSATIDSSRVMSQQVYLRLKNDGTNLTPYYSNDGKIWTALGPDPLSSFISSIDGFGIYSSSSKSNVPVDVICDWVRSV